MDTVQALSADINTAISIAKMCLGGTGLQACLCNIISQIKPQWINNLESPQQRCQGGNIFGLLVKKILLLITRVVDDAINGAIIDPINRAFGWLGANLKRICLAGKYNPPRYDCHYGEFNNTDLLGCYDSTDHAVQHQCYFTRQRSICMDNSDRYSRYQDLFKAPTASELEEKYKSIVGGSFQFIDPTFKALMDQVANAQPDWDVASSTNLCDASLFDSMDLDEIIIVCLFTYIESFCPSSDSADQFETFMNDQVVWQLPTVVFDWKAR